MARTYKLIKQQTRHSDRTPAYLLSVPAEIGRALEAAGQWHFEVELTDEGLLYRPATGEEATALPDWAKPKATE